jgi:hypothetical protein
MRSAVFLVVTSVRPGNQAGLDLWIKFNHDHLTVCEEACASSCSPPIALGPLSLLVLSVALA